MKLLFALLPLLSLTTSFRIPNSGYGYDQNNYMGGYNGNPGQNYGSYYPSSSWSSNNNQGSFGNSLKNMFNVMNKNNMNRMSSMGFGSGNMNNMNNMYNNNNINRMSRMTNINNMYDNNFMNNMNSFSRMDSQPGGYYTVSFSDFDVQKAYDYVEHHTNSLTQSSTLLKAASADRVTKQTANGINYKFEGLRFYKTNCAGYAIYNGQNRGFNQWWMNLSNHQQCQPQSATEFTNCDATVWWNPNGTPEYQVTNWRCR